MKKRIRIKDIAQRANVSRGTVDRVLHNRGNVSPQIRERILEVVDELKYERNIIASTLAYNKDFTIAVLLPDYKNDPFWEQPKQGIDTALRAVSHYGLSVKYYFFEQDDTQTFENQYTKVLEYKPDAILLAPDFYNESMAFLAECQQQGIPYIQINTYLDRNESCNLGYIGQDTYQSGLLAGRLLSYLVPTGSTIAVVHLEQGLTNAHHLIEKEKGFRDYFSQEGNQNEIIQLSFSPFGEKEELFNQLNERLSQIPDLSGMMVSTSRVYLLAEYFELNQYQKVKLVGFDLIEKNIQLLRKGQIQFLINQNPFRQGYYGIMNIVEHLIKKAKFDSIRNLPLDIVIRENVDYYLQATEDLKVIV